MVEAVLHNEMPSLSDCVVVRTALLQHYDIFAPVNLRRNLQGAKLDVSAPDPHTARTPCNHREPTMGRTGLNEV